MYPIKRNRRLRANQYIRNLVKENNISANDLIYPLFIVDGKGIKEEIPSMRDYYTISLDILKKEVKLLWKIGIQAVLIFPKIKESLKDNKGSEAINKDGLVQRAIMTIKESVPSMIVITDIALDPYSSYGHDGIVKNGEVIYEKYRGFSNLQHQIPFSNKTRSNIASTAKQFTAMMVLDLALKEKLNLDDNIRNYFPNLYKTVADKIRIRHLINHSSGIHEYVDLLGEEGKVWWKHVGLDNNDIMKLLEKQNNLEFRPGTKYNYSNSNYIVLAKIIEKVTGEKFTNYSKNFFNKLNMSETSFVERYMSVIPNRASPYSDWGKGEWWETPMVTKTSGEGFLYTTLRDQLTFEKEIQNSNNALFVKSQKPIPESKIETYCFGL